MFSENLVSISNYSHLLKFRIHTKSHAFHVRNSLHFSNLRVKTEVMSYVTRGELVILIDDEVWFSERKRQCEKEFLPKL